MLDHTRLQQLRENPTEWHRRGLRSPDEVEAIVHARSIDGGAPHPFDADVTYADFFEVAVA